MAAYSITFPPRNPVLRKYVKYIWAMIGDEPDGQGMLLPPVTDFDLVFSFKAGTDWTINSSSYSLNGSFTCGQRLKPSYIHARGVIDYLSVTFHPDCFFPFLGIPLSELSGEPVEFELLPGKLLPQATEQVAFHNDLNRKVELVEQLLLNHLAQIDVPDNRMLSQAVGLIKQSQGRMPVARICERCGTGTRKLERDFSKWIGVTPKQFIKIERFNHVFTEIARPGFDSDWLDLVARFGYHDQSHLIHDFKSMMEQTPEQFLYNLKNRPEIFAC